MRYIFGDSMLDTQQYELRHARGLVKLRPKVFQLLLYLITHRDRVVPKQELTAALWPDQSISEATLDSCLAEARQAVGDSGRSQQVIQTRYGYGYRFVAPVEVQSDPVTSVDDAGLSSPAPRTAVETARGRASTIGDSALASALPSGQHELEPPRPPSPWLLAGEHKMVTVLVCTLVHATRGASRREAEAWHQVRQTVVALMQDEVARYEGTLQEALEDSVLVLFGAPVAQEDHAQRAVQAALSLRERLRAVGVDPGGAPGALGAVRMGLHTGPLVIGRLHGDLRLDYTAVGDTITLPVQFAHLVSPGGIAISEATSTRVAGLFQLRVLDTLSPQGPGEPLRAFEVVRAHGRRTRWEVVVERGLTPHVGLARELAILTELFQQVKAGHGQVVCLAGEAGIGKSRHVFEFRRTLADVGDAVTWLEGRCLSFGQTMPLRPVVDHLRTAFGIEDADDAPAMRAKVDEGMRRLGTLEAHLPAMRYLLGGGPGRLRAGAPGTGRATHTAL